MRPLVVRPTHIKTQTVSEHRTEQDAIDAAGSVHALRNYGSCRRKAVLLIAASHAQKADPLQYFSVY